MDSGKQEGRAPSLLSVFGSVLASMFGVQSNRKREQDFAPVSYTHLTLPTTIGWCSSRWGGGR